MATARKRITRKELRQPDWFQVATEKAYEIYEGRRVMVLVGAAVLLGLLLAVWGWQVFKEHQNTRASEAFGRATAFYHDQNYREAISAFKTVESYRWSQYARFAYLYEANGYLALRDFNNALAAAQRFVNATSPDSVYRQIGLVTLAAVEEAKGQTKEALQHYSEAEAVNGAFKERALLGKARSAEKLGDLKTALAAYREYDKANPGSPIGIEIPALESKLASPPAAK